MRNGQKVTYLGKNAYYGYTGVIEGYVQGEKYFYIKGETSTLIATDYTKGGVSEYGIWKGRSCDCCGIIPKEITFDSSKLNIVYTCSDCEPETVKPPVFTRVFRFIKRLLIEPKGFTC